LREELITEVVRPWSVGVSRGIVSGGDVNCRTSKNNTRRGLRLKLHVWTGIRRAADTAMHPGRRHRAWQVWSSG